MKNEPSFYRPRAALDLLASIERDARERGRAMRESFDRIDEAEPQVRAMTALAPRDTALSAADAATGPLAGLAVAVKDIFDTSEFATSYGSPIYAQHRPICDAAIVTMLRRLGGVVIGKTVTSEFAYMAPTVTRNPCDLGRTPGGSSSGSAAAVAAGFAPFAIGTQTGGSTIRPASFCGIAGYKPTFGMLPTAGMKCFSWSIDTVGLFAATVRDAAYFGAALSGRELAVSGAHALEAPVFGVPEDYPWTAPTDNANAVLETAIRAIERAGGRIRRVRFAPWMAQMIAAHDTIQSYEACRTLGFEYDRHRAALTPMLAAFLERAGTIDTARYVEALAALQHARERLPEWFDGITALLTPGAPDEAPDDLDSTGDPAFNRNWTLLGVPCVNVPGLLGARGAPLGVQVIGRHGDDARCLAAAAFVERAIAAASGRAFAT
ncbi:MAG: amidase [Paraburkholderia sp.]|uniref:amidase n=1 Tax=Paraburkholderia sp. TaxID=1926495 RepID=UPI0012253F63|nr:amidase [Paraburkholderia sp.]TAL96071.1 MAG: amidase [Paraburkholderia sp.]